jgi:hypothetical protein
MAANEARPLPFLELPKELRLMVYERLTVRREKIGINLGEPARYHRPDVIIYKESAPVAILAICKQVHQEVSMRVLLLVDCSLLGLSSNLSSKTRQFPQILTGRLRPWSHCANKPEMIVIFSRIRS